MLVLTRFVDEVIVIGEGAEAVEVTLVAIRGNKARIGVSAPKHVVIDRKEITVAKEKENRDGH